MDLLKYESHFQIVLNNCKPAELELQPDKTVLKGP